MQPMTPEQVQNQKVDEKVMQIQQKRALQQDPSLQSATDLLKGQLGPKKPKLKPIPQIKVMTVNDVLIGAGEVNKKAGGGTIDDPYGSKKTRGMNPHKVIMGQGAAMMGGGNTKALKKNPHKNLNQ